MMQADIFFIFFQDYPFHLHAPPHLLVGCRIFRFKKMSALPFLNPPSAFYFHPSANAGEKTDEEKVSIIAGDILGKLPPVFDLAAALRKYAQSPQPPTYPKQHFLSALIPYSQGTRPRMKRA